MTAAFDQLRENGFSVLGACRLTERSRATRYRHHDRDGRENRHRPLRRQPSSAQRPARAWLAEAGYCASCPTGWSASCIDAGRYWCSNSSLGLPTTGRGTVCGKDYTVPAVRVLTCRRLVPNAARPLSRHSFDAPRGTVFGKDSVPAARVLPAGGLRGSGWSPVAPIRRFPLLFMAARP